MGPVLLFYMGIIIFVVRSAAGEFYGVFSFCKMPHEVIIQELRSVIAIESKEWEGEPFFYVFDLLKDTCFSFTPDGSLFRPSGGDVHGVYGICVHSQQ